MKNLAMKITAIMVVIFISACNSGGNVNVNNQDSIKPDNVPINPTVNTISEKINPQIKTPFSAMATLDNALNVKPSNIVNNTTSTTNCFNLAPQSNGDNYTTTVLSAEWYSTAQLKFTIKNTCPTAQLTNNLVIKMHNLQLNNANPVISDVAQSDNVNLATSLEQKEADTDLIINQPISCAGASWCQIPANTSKSFVINTSFSGPITSFNVDSVSIDGDTPPPPPPPPITTGELDITVDTTQLLPLCPNTSSCSIKLNIAAPSQQTTLTPIVVDPRVSSQVTTKYTDILPGKYSLILDNSSLPDAKGGQITPNYIPASATVDVPIGPSPATANLNFTYTEARQPQGNISINVANISGADTNIFKDIGMINGVVHATTANKDYFFMASIGSNFQFNNLPTDTYTVSLLGLADPITNTYYNVTPQTVVVSDNQTSITNLNFTKALNSTYAVDISVNNAPLGQLVQFAADNSKYKYNTNALLSQTYYFTESAIALTINAPWYTITSTPTPLILSSNIPNASINFKKQQSSAMVAGWPEYLAMGAIGGPNIDPTNAFNGDDGFGNKPVDAVFKYAGINGDGDPGVIDPPMNALRMTGDLTNVSTVNNHPSRVVIVEYTGQMSGGENLSDFTNTATPDINKQNATYIMGRHFVGLGADAIALADKPVILNGQKYYGSLIMNPDLLGALQQSEGISGGAYIPKVNALLTSGVVNNAIDQALCVLTNTYSYTNNDKNSITDWSDKLPRKDSYGKTYTGTAYSILTQMFKDTFPVWITSSAGDQYWGVGINNMIQGTESYSQVGQWFNACVTQPDYDHSKYVRPNFPAGFDGWVQANNWLIRTFAPAISKSEQVTFGWQDNMWAVRSGYWMHQDLTTDQIAQQYSTPITTWLQKNAPSAITTGNAYSPDYFVFDRYEMDDSASPGQATFYNARSWDNLITAVGQVSKSFNNIPMMLWQIPGSHISNTTESTPELYNSTAGSYIFSTAPVYFFGDNNLNPDLSNMIMGNSTTDANMAVGSFIMPILDPTSLTDGYHCPLGLCNNYQQYLLYYDGKANNFDWSRDNGKLAFATQNNIFAILWGGGNTTNVIKNFSNPDDHGWLANKLINYYQNPQPLVKN